LSNTAKAAGSVLNLISDQLRVLEKIDLEKTINAPLAYFDFGANPVDESKIKLLAPPPPLLPKNYTIDNFPSFVNPTTVLKTIGDSEIDSLINAYNALGIDVVSMILADHQLPQMSLVRAIYLQQIKQFHPDKSTDPDDGNANRKASIMTIPTPKSKQ